MFILEDGDDLQFKQKPGVMLALLVWKKRERYKKRERERQSDCDRRHPQVKKHKASSPII